MDETNNISGNVITVNNFFCWPDSDNLQVFRSSTVDIYRYSGTLLKNDLKILDNTLLFFREQVVLPAALNKRSNNSGIPANRTDKHLSVRITKFHTYIGNENVYHVPLRFSVDHGLVN